MNQIEFLEMMETMIRTKEIKLHEADAIECLEVIPNIKKSIMGYFKSYIVSEIVKEDCMNPDEAGYDNWYHFFGDTDGYETEEYMRELLTEEECENIWNDSHKKTK